MITPHLIRLIEDATADCREGRLEECFGHFYGVFLLTEFRAVEAWPSIRNAISLPGDKPYELFGDAITEDFGCIIATLAGDGFEAIKALITDRSVDEYVRWAACEAVLYRVRDGLLTKADAIDWFASHLDEAIANQDEVAVGLAMRLEDLAAEQKLPLIESAFATGLSDVELYVTFSFLSRSFVERLRRCRTIGATTSDTVVSSAAGRLAVLTGGR